MTVPTHILMGRTIEHFIGAALPVRLNRRWFLYGNIYPDVSHYLKSIPHFPDQSMGFVKRLIGTLCRTPVGVNGQIDPILSLQLGMLCHYMCDYFCHVHSSGFTGTTKSHFAYELRQQAMLASHPNRLLHLVPGVEENALLPDIDSIWSWLDEQQTEYLAKPHKPASDLALAVEKSSFVASSVMALCLKQAWANQSLSIPVFA